jgi:hypothetical protein
MKLPKGFNKNYFTLCAITATVNSVTMHAQRTRLHRFHGIVFASEELDSFEETEDPPIAESAQELFLKPCHCNRYYKKRTKKAIRLHSEQKTKPHIFIALNTAVSPP